MESYYASCLDDLDDDDQHQQRPPRRRTLPALPSTPPTISPLRHLYRNARETFLRSNANGALGQQLSDLASIASPLSQASFSPLKLQRRLESLAIKAKQSSVDRIGYDYATNTDDTSSPTTVSVAATVLSPNRSGGTVGIRCNGVDIEKDRETVHLRYLQSLLGSSRDNCSRLDAGASRESLSLTVDGKGRWSSPLSSGYQSQRSRDSFERPEESDFLEVATRVKHLDSLEQLEDLLHQRDTVVPTFDLATSVLSREFLLHLLHILLKDPRNVNLVYSPYALQAALAMLVPGSDGTTQDELVMTLFEPPYENPRVLVNRFVAVNRTVSSRNADCLMMTFGVYVDERNTIQPAYSELLARDFNALTKRINFRDHANACHLINCDINEATGGLIAEVVQPETLSPGTSVVLVHTICFKSSWSTEYRFTRRQLPFYGASSGYLPPRQTSFLLHCHTHEYFHDVHLGVSLVALAYERCTNIAMVLFLPDDERQSLTAMLRGPLAGDNLDYLLDSLRPTLVDLRFPEFHLDYTFDELVEQLRVLGICALFSPERANLRPMLDGGRGCVSKITQKVIIEVDLVAGRSRPQSMIGGGQLLAKHRFYADRPFLFALVTTDGPKREVLFMGGINDPTV